MRIGMLLCLICAFTIIVTGCGKSGDKTPAEKTEGMAQYRCEQCGYVYDPAKGDPDGGIATGTPFEKLPDGWECPDCGEPKNQFKRK